MIVGHMVRKTPPYVMEGDSSNRQTGWDQIHAGIPWRVDVAWNGC